MGKGLFWRSDFPEENSQEWEKVVTILQKDGESVVRLESLPA